MTLSEELHWRGFVNQTTYKDPSVLDGEPITFYWGVDPSANSMQIGNLAMALMVRHFIDHGHKAILLVGGATGLIGDPDGKAEERELKSFEQVAQNKAGIVAQYERVFDGKDFTVVDNYDWFKNLGYLEFLRDVGKHVPMRQMLGREFVQTRLSEEGAGISYAEFSYALIQGYDFLHLNRKHGATLQVAGSDQWGNCIAGVELIRRITGNEAHIWTGPLVVNNATGVKFGKTEGGAVWLDPEQTSAYKFYQFWLNVDDEGVSDYIKIYTLLSKEEIEHILQAFDTNRSARLAQKTLAYEVTKLVHGQQIADSVKAATEKSFSGDISSLTAEEFEMIGAGTKYDQGHEQPIIDILLSNELVTSKSQARQLMAQGAVTVNSIKVAGEDYQLTTQVTVDRYALIRVGKNKQLVFKIND